MIWKSDTKEIHNKLKIKEWILYFVFSKRKKKRRKRKRNIEIESGNKAVNNEGDETRNYKIKDTQIITSRRKVKFFFVSLASFSQATI